MEKSRMKLAFFALLTTLAVSASAAPLKWEGFVTFWKRGIEANGSVSPLPVPVGSPRPVSFGIPDTTTEISLSTRTEIVSAETKAEIMIFRVKKAGVPEYTVLQVRLRTLSGSLLAECSRFDSIADGLPPGSCGGAHEGGIAGVSFSR